MDWYLCELRLIPEKVEGSDAIFGVIVVVVHDETIPVSRVNNVL